MLYFCAIYTTKDGHTKNKVISFDELCFSYVFHFGSYFNVRAYTRALRVLKNISVEVST